MLDRPVKERYYHKVLSVMNSEKNPLSVAIIGIPEHERNILRNIFKLSLYRTHTYTLMPGDEASHILLIDADDPDALADWETLCKGGKNRLPWRDGSEDSAELAPSVMVARDQPANDPSHWIRRPFIATRVLSVLDQIAARLPAKPVPSVIAGPEPAAILQPAVVIPTVLVVDDSSTVRRQVGLELERLDVHVDAAESGEQAFELLARNRYDLIFLDVILPGVDGYHLCKAIKKDKTMKKTPVVMLTSKSSPFDRVKGALSGCDAYLTKPVKQSAFQGVVKKYLKN